MADARRLIAALLALAIGLPAIAADAPAASAASAPATVKFEAPAAHLTAADPALEARMLAITGELRCLVCQNQTIADSHADLAVDLRQEVRELLQKGRTPDQIRQYMTARYGDFVLYRPPLRTKTVPLWFGPALLLLIGGTVLVLTLRRRSRMAADAFDPDVDDDEIESLDDAAATAARSATAPGRG